MDWRFVQQPQPPPGPDHCLLRSCLLVLGAVLAVGSLWVVDYLPTHDGPQHLFSAHLEGCFDRLPEPYHSLIVAQPHLTSHAFPRVFVLLEPLVGWRQALRLTLSLWVLVWTLGAGWLVTAVEPRRWMLVLLAPPMALCWGLYLGFFNYVAGTGLGLLLLAAALTYRRPGPVLAAALSALLVLQAMLHTFTAMLTGLVLVLVVTVRAGPGSRLRQLLLLALIGLPAACYALAVVLLSSGSSGRLAWFGLGGQLLMVLRSTAVGPLWRCLPLLLLALTGTGLTLARWQRCRPVERGLAVASLALFLLAAAMPFEIPGWEGLSPRFSPTAALCGMALLPVERLPGRRIRAAVATLLALLAVASLAWSYQFHRRLRQGCAPLLQALEPPAGNAVAHHGFRFFVAFRSCLSEAVTRETPDVSGACFVQHAGSLFATAQGGLPPSFQGDLGIHRFSFTTYDTPGMPPAQPLDWRSLVAALEALPQGAGHAADNRLAWQMVSTRIAEHAAHFEDLIIFGSREERQLICERGFSTDRDDELIFLGRFQGCACQVALPPGWGVAAPVLLEYGWWPLETPSWGTRIYGGQGSHPISLPRSPCGPIWIRVVLDRDGSGDRSAGDLVCAGADETGLVALSARQTEAAWRCEPGEPLPPGPGAGVH